MCLIRDAHPHREWGCASPGIHIHTENEDVTHRECTSSPGMGICLTGNGDVTDREWGCDSLGMYILTGNAHNLDRVFKVVSYFTPTVTRKLQKDCLTAAACRCKTFFISSAYSEAAYPISLQN